MRNKIRMRIFGSAASGTRNSHCFGLFSAMETPIGVNPVLMDPYLRALQPSSWTLLEISDVRIAVPCGTRLTGIARFFWFEYGQQSLFWPDLGDGNSDRGESSAQSSVSSSTTILVLKSHSYSERTRGSFMRKSAGRFGSSGDSDP